MALLPKVKLKALVSFPANVTDGVGIDVVKENGNYQFDIAFDDFAPPVAGLTDPANQCVLVWNSVTDSYVLAPAIVFGSAGTVPEAPNDGIQYGRQSLSWTQISASGAAFTPTGDIAATTVQAAIVELDNEKVAIAGDTMTGPLILSGDPITASLQAATKAYVDASAGGGGDVTGPASVTADGNIAVYNGTTGEIIKDGLVKISDLQPADAELTALAGLTSAANQVPIFTGSGTATTITVSVAAQSVLDDASVAAMLATLGGQPLDTELTALATTTSAADQVPYFTGLGAATTMTVTSVARSVLDDTSLAAMLATLGGQPLDADLTAIAALSGTGFLKRVDATPTWSVGYLLTNAELDTMPAYTIKANATGGTAAPDDINIASLSLKTPGGADYLLLSDTAASGALKKITIASLPGATSIGEAPTDGQVYGRQGSTASWVVAGGGGIPDGDKGDITTSGGGTTWTIDATAVTFAKMQNIATDSLIGRDTASSGVPENITLGASLSMNGSQVLQRAALTGDVTASVNSNATTIAANAVTNAKAAQMAAYTIKANATGVLADAQDITGISGFTNKAVPVGADLLLISDSAAANVFKQITISSLPVPTTITVANEVADTTCFIGFWPDATGNSSPKTNATMTFNASTQVVTFGSSILTTTDINGGTVDAATIGGSTPAAATFTAAVANSFVPNSATIPSNGMYLPAANTLGWSINSAIELQLTAAGLLPGVNDGTALGSTTLGFADLHLATGGVINWANGEITLTETDANTLTFAGGVFVVPTGGLQVGASVPFADAAGVLTLQNVDALDATTETTIEGAIDTLANLTSIQGRTVTFTDATFDVLSGWDDSADAHKNFLLADILTEAAPATGDFLLIYGAEGDFRKVNWSSLPAGSFTTASTTEVLTGTDTAKGVTPDALAALWEKGTAVASAATISLGEGGYFHITGTTGITDIDFTTAKDGRFAVLVFDGILTLTHNATTLILPGGANITTAAGDTCIVVQDASDNVKVVSYQRANGAPLKAGWEFISTTTISGAPTNVDYTGLDALPYVRYLFQFRSLKPATDGQELVCRIGTGAGPTYQTGTTYQTVGTYGDGGGMSPWSTTITLSSRMFISDVVGNSTNETLQGSLIFSVGDGSNYPTVTSEATWRNATTIMLSAWLTSQYESAVVSTAIRFFFDVGTFANAGSIDCYGLRAS